MKKKVLVIATLAMLAAAPAFADDGGQQGGNWQNDMYQYCNKAMQQWGNGGQQPPQGGQGQPQSQPMSYNGGMMGGGSYGGMMGSGNMMGNGSNMMGGGSYGGMMGSVEFR